MTRQAKPQGGTGEATELRASGVETEGRKLAEKLRQEGLARARGIIARAEREAQAVIRSAQEAADAAAGQARERAEAILAGKPVPAQTDEQPAPGNEVRAGDGTTRARISALSPDGSTLRYRICAPLSFPALLRLKRDVSQFPGVSGVNILPAEKGEAVLSLKANDSAEVWRLLLSVPGLAEPKA